MTQNKESLNKRLLKIVEDFDCNATDAEKREHKRKIREEVIRILRESHEKHEEELRQYRIKNSGRYLL